MAQIRCSMFLLDDKGTLFDLVLLVVIIIDFKELMKGNGEKKSRYQFVVIDLNVYRLY